ncbi:MAG: aldo/keto reductase [Bryobacteraceae bacterium]
MRYRRLGRTDYEVSEVGYGAWGIGGNMWTGGRDEESLAALRRAIELGLSFIDTALAYGEGHSERLVGQVVRETDHKIYVATKVPPKNRVWPAHPETPMDEVFPYSYIMESTEQSLRNLGLEQIDLQQLHVWNPEWIGRDEWRRAFEDMKSSGKVKAVGVSINDHQPNTALEAIETGLIDSVQVIYNIFDRSAEERLFPLTQARNVGVIARVPFDEGSLTGRITEQSAWDPSDFRSRYFSGDRKKQVVDRVNALEADLNIGTDELPEIALRFCLTHPAVSTAIPGMRSRRNVEANCAVPDRGPLPAEVMEKLDKHRWERNFYSAA